MIRFLCVLSTILTCSCLQDSKCSAQRSSEVGRFSQTVDKETQAEIGNATKTLRSIANPFTKHRKQALEVLKKHAPRDKPGIGIAHWKIVEMEFLKTRAGEKMDYSTVAAHLKHCISLDPTNTYYVDLYTKALVALGENDAAATEYLKVFEKNPFKVHHLVALNKKLGKDEENRQLLEQAWPKMEKSLGDEKFIRRRLIEEIQDLEKLEPFLEDPTPAIKLIETMTSKSAKISGPTMGTSQTFRLLARLTSKQAANLAETNPEAIEDRLELYRQALEYDPTDKAAKTALTRIIIDGGKNADLALALYDPKTDRKSPPSTVIELLANNANKNNDPKSVVEVLNKQRNLSKANLIQYCKASLKLDDAQVNQAMKRLNKKTRRTKEPDIDLEKWRGLLLAKTGSHGTAIDILKRYLEQQPQDDQALAAIKKSMAVLKQKAEAFSKKTPTAQDKD